MLRYGGGVQHFFSREIPQFGSSRHAHPKKCFLGEKNNAAVIKPGEDLVASRAHDENQNAKKNRKNGVFFRDDFGLRSPPA